MYKQTKPNKVTLDENKSMVGESIETKMARILNNKEPIKDGAPRIYTERKDGVQAQYDIRTDRFEIGVEAMDKVAKAHIAKRDNLGVTAKQNMEKEAKSETKDEAKGQSLGGESQNEIPS